MKKNKKSKILKQTAICLGIAIFIIFLNINTLANMNAVSKVASEIDSMSSSIKGSTDTTMKIVAEDDSIALYVNMSTSDFYVLDKVTGYKYYSSPPDIDTDKVANDDVKARMYSVLSIEFSDNKNASYSMNTKNDAIPFQQVSVSKIKDGIKSVFTIGKKDTRSVIPQVMLKDEFQNYISKLSSNDAIKIKNCYKLYSLKDIFDAKQKSDLIHKYPKIKDTDLYILRPNQPSRLMEQVEDVFKKAGLTVDIIDSNYALIGYKSEKAATPYFVIPIEFRIENNQFVSEIISKEIQIPSKFILTNITVLEYFGAASSSEKGSFLVPDGSGALISFNKNSDIKSYAQSIYGTDDSIKKDEKNFLGQTAQMPVFGMNYTNRGMFAIIESGEFLCSVNAAISGSFSTYNNIYSKFNVSPSSFLSYNDRMVSNGIYLFSKDISRVNIKINYAFFDARHCDYVNMAKYYREQLKANGYITKLSNTNENVPFLMDLYGSIESKKMFLGIPFDSMKPLTTFKQAQDIYNQVKNKGISNLAVGYIGWNNGGLSNYLNNSLNVQSELGGMKGMQQFATFLKKNNSGFYPNVDFLYVSKDALFDNFSAHKDAAYFLDKKIATVFPYNLASYNAYSEPQYGKYIVSPRTITNDVLSFISHYSKIGNDAISVGTFGSKVNSDFSSKNYIDRNMAGKIIAENLDRIKKKNVNIMVENGNVFSLPYTSFIKDLPLFSSGLDIEDESIPFYEIVLHGYVQYAGEAINISLNEKLNFLKSVETGAGIYYKWMYANDEAMNNTKYMYSNYSLCYANRIDEAATIYKKMNSVLKDTQNCTIEDHIKLMDNVYKTIYSNGTAVVVNYNMEQVIVDGVKIGPEDFSVVGGVK